MNDLSFTYGDSMKYIHKYICDNGLNYEVVFPIKRGEIENTAKIVAVKPFTIKYFYLLLTSKAIVVNVGGISYLPIRKKQVVINTWHGGGPYKKTSTDVYKNKLYRLETEMNANNIDYLLSSCKYFSEYEAKSMLIDDSKIIPCGLPRNDVLFKDTREIREKVLSYYSIDRDSKIVLYAPTYRVNLDNYTNPKELNKIDIDYERVKDALERKFGAKWVFAIRVHPMVSIDSDKIGGMINFSNYPDMQELLCAADVVIGDFSSLMWDFSFTYRPLFVYAPDLDYYESKRGFYMPSSEWPYSISRSNEELVNSIINFNSEEYKYAVARHHEASGSYETGKACKKVIELIEGF